jgi:hypothetical protein
MADSVSYLILGRHRIPRHSKLPGDLRLGHPALRMEDVPEVCMAGPGLRLRS